MILPAEQRALDAIDMDTLVAMACDLVAIESTSGRETPAQTFVATQLAAVGMDVDQWELDVEMLRSVRRRCRILRPPKRAQLRHTADSRPLFSVRGCPL